MYGSSSESENFKQNVSGWLLDVLQESTDKPTTQYNALLVSYSKITHSTF